MPNHFETIPTVKSNLQFPGGDIPHEAFIRADELQRRLARGDREKRIRSLAWLRHAEIPQWRCIAGQEVVFQSLASLAKSWAGTLMPESDYAQAIAQLSLEHSLAFIKRSKLLPFNLRDFSEELSGMENFDELQITSFKDEAWFSMQYHPYVFAQLDSWYDTLEDVYAISSEDERTLVQSMVALPYIVASTGRMVGYFPKNIDHLPEKAGGSEGSADNS